MTPSPHDAALAAQPMPIPPRRRGTLLYRTKLLALLYLLLMPTVVGVITFTYVPNIEVVKYAFYRWDGAQIEEYVGLNNFHQAITSDPLFWNSFGLVGIMLVANLFKMWPSIFVAIALHRLSNQRLQYLYRVLFVVPMVIPGLVWLLVWKTFFTSGMLSDLLNSTGLMPVLNAADVALPKLAASVAAAPFHPIEAAFGSSWGLGAFGLACMAATTGLAGVLRRWPAWLAIAVLGAVLWGPIRLPILLAAALIAGEALRRRDAFAAPTRMRAAGWIALMLAGLVILLTETWTTTSHQFHALADGRPPTPAWLSDSRLIIPSLILWGFPWVGTIGVLIYLAGLQNISTEVYEAAELDGVGFWGKIFRIELPLILTQVRINLIFMTISTLTDYAFYLLLLGSSGGPGNRGLVPGLYMYNKAFVDGEFGYACTLGMCMFVIVLALTLFYQKYVTVEK